MSMSSKDLRKAGGAPVPPVVAQQPVEPAIAAPPDAKSEVAPTAPAPSTNAIAAQRALDTLAAANKPAPVPPSVPEPAPAPSVPAGHVLARWTGAGTFAGRCYAFPSGKEMPCAKGPTLAYFDEASVRKLGAPAFEVHQATADGASSPVKVVVSDAAPPEGFLLARWTGAGRFAGGYLTFPERVEKPYAQGPTVGYFPAASVKKLGKLFEIL